MADASFPFPAIGSVHLENTIIQYRPVSTCETVSMSLKADNLRHHQGWSADMTWWAPSETRSCGSRSRPTSASARAATRRTATPVAPSLTEGSVWSIPEKQHSWVRHGVRRPRPDPPLPADGEGPRLPAPHRARHVEQGTVRRGAGPAARPAPGGGGIQEADLPAQFGAVAGAGGWDFALVDPKSGAPHLLGHTTTL